MTLSKLPFNGFVKVESQSNNPPRDERIGTCVY